jgi:hypothetical protein
LLVLDAQAHSKLLERLAEIAVIVSLFTAGLKLRISLRHRRWFEGATAEAKIDAHSILLLAGSQEQLDRYGELFCIYHVSSAPVLIVGGGRVGRATARALTERDSLAQSLHLRAQLTSRRIARILQILKQVHGDGARRIRFTAVTRPAWSRRRLLSKRRRRPQ